MAIPAWVRLSSDRVAAQTIAAHRERERRDLVSPGRHEIHQYPLDVDVAV